MVYELATEITLLDPHRLKITLRDGVNLPRREPFKAEDVKATFEYGARSDRRRNGIPAPPRR